MNQLVVVLVAIALVTAGLSAVKVVPAHERSVVFRFGRVSRVREPGLMMFIPLVERVRAVTSRIGRLDNLFAVSATNDDVLVEVRAGAQFRVVDPILATVTVSNIAQSTALALESTLRTSLHATDLRVLAHNESDLVDRVLDEVNDLTESWGVEVVAIDVLSIELRVGTQLLQWAEHLSDVPPGSGR